MDGRWMSCLVRVGHHICLICEFRWNANGKPDAANRKWSWNVCEMYVKQFKEISMRCRCWQTDDGRERGWMDFCHFILRRVHTEMGLHAEKRKAIKTSFVRPALTSHITKHRNHRRFAYRYIRLFAAHRRPWPMVFSCSSVCAVCIVYVLVYLGGWSNENRIDYSLAQIVDQLFTNGSHEYASVPGVK